LWGGRGRAEVTNDLEFRHGVRYTDLIMIKYHHYKIFLVAGDSSLSEVHTVNKNCMYIKETFIIIKLG
jgi:hypothetical protein